MRVSIRAVVFVEVVRGASGNRRTREDAMSVTAPAD